MVKRQIIGFLVDIPQTVTNFQFLHFLFQPRQLRGKGFPRHNTIFVKVFEQLRDLQFHKRRNTVGQAVFVQELDKQIIRPLSSGFCGRHGVQADPLAMEATVIVQIFLLIAVADHIPIALAALQQPRQRTKLDLLVVRVSRLITDLNTRQHVLDFHKIFLADNRLPMAFDRFLD